MAAPFAQGDLDKWHYTILSYIAHAFLLARQNGCARDVGWVSPYSAASRVSSEMISFMLLVFSYVSHMLRGVRAHVRLPSLPQILPQMGDFPRNTRVCILMDRACADVTLEEVSSASLSGAQSGADEDSGATADDGWWR